jgi:hypothetical protein
MSGLVNSIGQMKDAGWHLCATCQTCRTRLWVDIDTLIARLGRDAFFWGCTARCRVWTWGDRERCPGRVVFSARSIQGGSWVPLKYDREAHRRWRCEREGRNPNDYDRFFLDGTVPQR